MFGWVKKFKVAQRHRLISQNFFANEVATDYYGRKRDIEQIKDLEALYLENLRIAKTFYETDEVAPADYQKLTKLHAKMRDIFQQIYPGKSFDRTFGPRWTSGSEIKD